MRHLAHRPHHSPWWRADLRRSGWHRQDDPAHGGPSACRRAVLHRAVRTGRRAGEASAVPRDAATHTTHVRRHDRGGAARCPRQLVQHRRAGARTDRRPEGPDGARPAGCARRPGLGGHPPDRAQRTRGAGRRRRALGGRGVPGLADRLRGAGRGTGHADPRGLSAQRDPRRRRLAAGPDESPGNTSARAGHAHHERGGTHRPRRPGRERRRRVLSRVLGDHRRKPPSRSSSWR